LLLVGHQAPLESGMTFAVSFRAHPRPPRRYRHALQTGT
jgi:hypothetical protein